MGHNKSDLRKNIEPPFSQNHAQDIYKIIFEQSPVSTQVFTPDGTLIRANKAWEKLWGVKFSSVKGYNILRDQQLVALKIMPLIKKGFKGETILFPPVRYEPNKTMAKVSSIPYRWTRSLMYSVRDEKGSIREVVLVHEDITEQKTIEEHLNQSEARYRIFIEQSSEGIWRFELEKPLDITLSTAKQIKHMFTYAYLAECNDSMAKMYGYKKASDLVGSRLSDLMVQEDEQNIAYLTAFIQSGYRLTSVESHEQDKKGRDKYFSNSLVGMIEDGHIARAWGTQVDVTEIRNAEEKLRKNEELYRQLVETTNVIPWESDVATGNFTYVGPQALKLLGYPIREWYKDNFWVEHIHPDDKEWVFRYCLESSKKKDQYEFEYRMLDKKGKSVWFRDVVSVIRKNGVPFTLRGFMFDITNKKITEDHLGRLAAIVEASDDAIVGRTLEGKVTSWNKGAEEMYGYTAEEMQDKNVSILIPDDKKDDLDLIREKIFKGERVEHFETIRLRKDGTRLDASVSVAPIRDDSGNIIGVSTITRDITQQKALEKQKDEFIAVASHELKTPVTSLKVYGQVLHKRFATSGDVRSAEVISKMDAQFDKLTSLVSDLLDVSKIETGKLQFKFEWFDFNELVREVVEEMQRITESHRLVAKLDKTKSIRGDRDRISQVLVNFISNAIKYSPRANKIIVTTHVNKNSISASVQDFGVGITKKEQVQIFDRFYRAEGAKQITFPGLGLGLYISSEIIKRHKGTIKVESEAKKGSTFSFSLPLKTK